MKITVNSDGNVRTITLVDILNGGGYEKKMKTLEQPEKELVIELWLGEKEALITINIDRTSTQVEIHMNLAEFNALMHVGVTIARNFLNENNRKELDMFMEISKDMMPTGIIGDAKILYGRNGSVHYHDNRIDGHISVPLGIRMMEEGMDISQIQTELRKQRILQDCPELSAREEAFLAFQKLSAREEAFLAFQKL